MDIIVFFFTFFLHYSFLPFLTFLYTEFTFSKLFTQSAQQQSVWTKLWIFYLIQNAFNNLLLLFNDLLMI